MQQISKIGKNGDRETATEASGRLDVSSRYGNGINVFQSPHRFEMNPAHEAGTEDCRSDRIHLFSISTALDPPGSARLLANHNVVEEGSGLGQALLWREQAIFVLD